jgi:uncharacterized membrane protein (UPF0136 family)
MWEKINKVSVQVIVAVISIVASFGLLYLLVFKEVPTGNRDLFNVMIGVVIGSTVTAVVGWLFTQSKNSGGNVAKTLLIIFASSALLTSCSRKTLPGTTTVITKTDSIVETKTAIQKDTVIIIQADSVTIHDTIPCPDVIYHKEAYSDGGNIKATVDINKGRLTVDCKTDSLVQQISWLEWQLKSERWVNENKTVEKPFEVKVPTPYIPKVFWYVLVYAIGLTVWTFRKPLLSLITHFVTKWNK